MEGGKVVPYQTELFWLGKTMGTFTAITFFSVILSFISNGFQFQFHPSRFTAIFLAAIILHLLIQGMVKKRWL